MIIFFALLSAVVSCGLSYLLLRTSRKKHFALAIPRERDIHSSPTPKLGGVAIAVSFLLLVLILASFAPDQYRNFGFPFAFWGISIDKRLLGIILAVVILSAVMLKDDLKDIRPIYKLAAQIAAALILIAAGVGITYINNPFGNSIQLDQIALPVTIGETSYRLILYADLFFVAWTILLTNATNFIDGLDGLATSLAIISGAVIAGLALRMNDFATATLAGIWAGAMIGFLPFNLPYGKKPARMFLGDTGSQFLGLMLAILTVISGGKLATIMLVFGVVILNALYVVAKRILQGKNPFTSPDNSHIHHRFLQAGFSKIATLAIICTISATFGFCALIFDGKTKIITLGILAIISLIGFIALDLKIHKKTSLQPSINKR